MKAQGLVQEVRSIEVHFIYPIIRLFALDISHNYGGIIWLTPSCYMLYFFWSIYIFFGSVLGYARTNPGKL